MQIFRFTMFFIYFTFCGGLAQAEAFPSRPIRLIVPYAPGGSTDVLARMVSDSLRAHLGQPVIVENKPGGGTLLGTDAVARAKPDGYSLLLTSSAYTVNPVINPRFRAEGKELQPVFLMVKLPHVLVVNSSSPYKSISDLVAAAKSKAGVLNYASSGTGSSTHLEGELLARMANINIVHVPYGGASLGITDLMSGQVQMMFGSLPALLPQIKAGKLRALGITVARPIPQLPDVPSIAASGVPGYDVADWLGIFAPMGTDRNTLGKLVEALTITFADEKFVSRLVDLGMDVEAQGPARFQEFLRNDALAKVAREAGIKVTE